MFDFIGNAVDTVKSAGASAHEWLSKPDRVEEVVSTGMSAVTETLGDLGGGLQKEGISGLLDPVGMMHRQQTARELAPYFAITPEDFVGPMPDHNHNTVSPEEFDKVVRTMSDIELGRGDIQIDTSRMANDDEGDLYREGVMKDLALIMQTTSGRRQIQALSDNEGDYKTTIKPAFIPFYDGDKEERTFEHAKGGSGSAEAWDENETRIRYKPGDDNYGDRSDVILAHELEHGRHYMQGTTASGDFYGGEGHPDSPHVDPMMVDENVRVPNAERQATGLTNLDGLHPTNDEGCTENRYRYERNQLGDHLLPRTHYSGQMPQEERDVSTLTRLWSAFIEGPDDAVID